VTDFREAVRQNDYERFKQYTDDIDKNSGVTLRSQLEFVNVANVKMLPMANSNGQLETRHSLRSACSRGLLRPLRGSAFGLGQPDDFVAGASPHGSRTPARGGYGNIGTGYFHIGNIHQLQLKNSNPERECSAVDSHFRFAQQNSDKSGGM
jgi:hypothetical protein